MRNTAASASNAFSPAGARRNFFQRPVDPPPVQILNSTERNVNTEMLVVLACCRVSMGAAEAAQLRNLVREKIDWEAVISIAHKHRVTALLYHNLKSVCAAAVPASVLQRLRERFHANLAANLALAREMAELVLLFRDNGIQVLPFKGTPTAVSLYGSLALRSAGDLDLLIHRRDVSHATDLLLNRGYTLVTEHSPGNAYRTLELQFSRPSDNLLVELRWRITSWYFSGSLDLAYLGPYLQPLKVLETEAPNLAPEELLVSLCVHGSKHRWERLMWVCDMAELLRAYPGLDWERVERHASGLGLSRPLGCGLLMAWELLEAPVPEQVLRRLAAKSCRRTAREDCLELLGKPQAKAPFRSHMRLMERRRDQLRYTFLFFYDKLQYALPTDEDRAAVPLPQRLGFLYFAFRPVRLLIQYGFAPLWRRVRGRRDSAGGYF